MLGDDFSHLTLESNMKFDVFYRRFGVRRVSDILSPRVSNILELKLPKAAVAHHVSYDGLTLGPEPTGTVYGKHTGRVLVDHVVSLFEPESVPRLVPGKQPISLKRDYHKRYKQFRPLKDFDRSVREEKTLIIENYAILNQAYKYQQTIYAPYIKWANIVKTVFHTMADIANKCDRDQFLFIQLPKVLPALTELRFAAGSKTLKRDLIEKFSSAEACFLLEIWRWLDDSQEIVSNISLISPEKLDKINFVYVDGSNWFVLNLKTFINIEDIDVSTDEGPGRTKQRRFIKMLLSLIEQRTSPVVNTEELVEDETGDDGEVDNEIIVVKKDDVEIQKPKDDKVITDNPYDDDHDDYGVSDDEVAEIDEEPLDTAVIAKELEDDELDAKLAEANDLSVKANKETVKRNVRVKKTPDEPKLVLMGKLEQLADGGSLTAAEYKRAKALIEKTDTIANPFGEGTLVEFAKTDESDFKVDESIAQLPNLKGVVDKSMLRSRIKAMDEQYITKVMRKNILESALAVQSAGFIVNDVNAEVVEEYGNKYTVLSIKTTALKGDTGTIRVRFPVVEEDRSFVANGVKYHMKKQKVDIPIRKVNPARVALTSDYGKLFVERSDKSVVNYPLWLHRQMGLIEIDSTKSVSLTNVKRLDTFIADVKLPRIYTTLAMRYREFTINDTYRIYVDYVHRDKTFDLALIAKAEEDGLFFCGVKGKTPIVVDMNNVFYLSESKGLVELGTIETLLKITDKTPPTEIAEFKVFSKQVPVGIALGYRYGLSGLMSVLGVSARRVFSGQNANVQPDEFALKFADETLVFARDNKVAEMILAGFNRYHATIKEYNVDVFDDADVYINVLEANGFKIGIIREIGLAYDMFVDPLTKKILKRMKEPLTLEELLIRSCELLTTDEHPEEVDESVMRYRGYDRFAGHLYSHLVSSVRQQRSQGAGGVSKLQLNPEALWMSIIQDGSVSPVEESNPIHNLKEAEIFTFAGTGGRSARSMVKRTRKFSDKSLGVVSEATVDSGMVGVNAYLSADPNIDNLYGVPESKDTLDLTAANMFSTSALMAPAVEMDSPPRINFVSIQHTHGVASVGNRPLPFRTGEEKTLAHKVGPLFASTAPKDGKVIELSKRHIRIHYNDKTEQSYALGVTHGTVTGTTVPHNLVTTFKLNDKVKAGDVVVYNEGFFEPDALDPKQVLWKAGVLATIAIAESPHTFEDSSEISERVAEKLATKMTFIRTVIVRFDQKVSNMVSIGEHLDVESILCTVEDGVTADSDMFNEESLETLEMLASNTPRAKHDGVIDKIEVLYHGDYDDMSESIRSIVDKSDKELKKTATVLGKTPLTGEITSNIRIDGNPLDLDSVAIRFYITGTLKAGVGDKGVIANQMKTVHSNVLTGVNKTESGREIDGKFAYMSFMARATLSPEVIGTTISLLEVFSKEASDAYFGD